MKKEELINDMSLMLMYLSNWDEKSDDEHNFDLPKCDDGKVHKAWKGYSFDTINALKEKRYIKDGYGKAPNIFYQEGIDAAKALLKKYGIAVPNE